MFSKIIDEIVDYARADDPQPSTSRSGEDADDEPDDLSEPTSSTDAAPGIKISYIGSNNETKHILCYISK